MRPLGIDLEHYFLMKKERINLGSLAMLSKKKQPCISNGALSLKQLKGLQGNRGSLKRDVNGAGDPKSVEDRHFELDCQILKKREKVIALGLRLGEYKINDF